MPKLGWTWPQDHRFCPCNPEPNDKQQLEPTLKELVALPKELGKVSGLISDRGYFSETNVQACENQGITPYIAIGREHHHQDPWDRFREPPALRKVPMR